MSDLNSIIPEDATIIAEGEGYAVFEIEIEDLGTYYILKGLGTIDTEYLFSKQGWDDFARFIAFADLKIRGVTE